MSNAAKIILGTVSLRYCSCVTSKNLIRTVGNLHKNVVAERKVTHTGNSPQHVHLTADAIIQQQIREPLVNNASSLFSAYMQLSKCRLTALIASTAISGFVMSPALAAAPASLFVTCVAGTALLSASASTCNNIIERQHDSQMRRTQSRVLPVGRLTPVHAMAFATMTGVAGLGLLCLGCNHLTSGLGFLNLALYAGFYTPMKRIHHSCTWVGALVGAIPPLMGYSAATGHLDSAALLMGALLFSWQFPHFNALSWNLRDDYQRAGYQMMCVTDEQLCRRTTFRHSVAMFFLCSLLAPLTELTTWTFALTSAPLNLGMIYLGWQFYKRPDKTSARHLFRFTLIYLPVLMVLMYASKEERRSTPDHATSNREVGSLELAKEFLEKKWTSFACDRESEELDD